MSVGIVVLTRDLRLHDHPALCAAIEEHEEVAPLFVFDEAILAGPFNAPNRTGFLLEALDDLDGSLKAIGGRLFVRQGSFAEVVAGFAHELDAAAVHVSADVSRYASVRLSRLRERLGPTVVVHEHPGVTVVDPGAIVPSGGGCFKIFTPYYRRWSEVPYRSVLPAPEGLVVPRSIDAGTLPLPRELFSDARSPSLPIGGEHAARELANRFVRERLADYGERRDLLAEDATSGLAPYLHFGCISPLELVARLKGRPGSEPFVRQLCWRDFYHQILAARPEVAEVDFRPRRGEWRSDPEALSAWKEGRTGFPVVDAAMRQLAAEGTMHNRARMIVASFLTKDLAIDWRVGARHFASLLTDGDLANNTLNWQWVAGVGSDTNPFRIFNPTAQGRRFDPDGEYVRRYVAELRSIPGGAVHDPDPELRRRLGYPVPIVDHHQAIEEYRQRFG